MCRQLTSGSSYIWFLAVRIYIFMLVQQTFYWLSYLRITRHFWMPDSQYHSRVFYVIIPSGNYCVLHTFNLSRHTAIVYVICTRQILFPWTLISSIVTEPQLILLKDQWEGDALILSLNVTKVKVKNGLIQLLAQHARHLNFQKWWSAHVISFPCMQASTYHHRVGLWLAIFSTWCGYFFGKK